MIQLTDDEVKYLFKFVEKKFVRQYDVQVELVDHLASQVEELMSGEQALNFSDALDTVFAGFGIREFDKLVQSRTKAAIRQGRKMWWAKFKSLFGWPELLLSVVIFGLLYASIHLFGLFPVSLTIEVLIYAITLRMIRLPGTRKHFASMSFSTSSVYGSFFMFSSLPVHTYQHDGAYPQSIIYCGMIFLQILCFKAFYQVHRELLSEVRTQYPHVFAQ